MERVQENFLEYVISGPTREKAIMLRKTRVSRQNKGKAQGIKEHGACMKQKEYVMCEKYGRGKRLERHLKVRHRHMPLYLSIIFLSTYVAI